MNIQNAVMANKTRRGFNTTEVWPEIIHMTEELGELARAFRDYQSNPTFVNMIRMVDANADLALYCYGLFSILGYDAEQVLERVVRENETREYRNAGVREKI
jgi:NTP pyrophosphatase (non-canonical NTP hydrolase)